MESGVEETDGKKTRVKAIGVRETGRRRECKLARIQEEKMIG